MSSSGIRIFTDDVWNDEQFNFVVPKEIVEERELSIEHFGAYVYMLSLARIGEPVSPQQLRAGLGVSKAKYERILQDLSRSGWLVRQRTRGKGALFVGSVYRLKTQRSLNGDMEV